MWSLTRHFRGFVPALFASLLGAPLLASSPVDPVLQALAEAEQGLRSQEIQIAESRYRSALLEGWMLLGALEVTEGQLIAARQAFETATQVAVATRRPRRSLAMVHLELGESERAAEILRELLVRHPRDLIARRLLARALVAQGDAEEAVRELEVARAANPEDLELAFTLATGYLRLEDYETAEGLFRQVVEARPIPQTWILIGRTWRDFQAFEPAKAALRRALELDSKIPRANYYLGTVELRADGRARLDEAIKHFRAELNIVPDDVVSHLYLGLALVEGRRFEEALEPLKVAAAAPSPAADAFLFLGQGYLGLGRIDEAATALRRALELSDGSSHDQLTSIHYQLALAERRRGNEDAAAEHFDAARSSSADLASDSRQRLGRYLAESPEGQPELSTPPSLEVAALTPLSAEQRQQLRATVTQALARSYLNLGIMQTQASRFLRAGDLFQATVDLAPDFPQAQYSLGVARFNAEQFDLAVAPLRHALDERTDDPTLRRMLALAELHGGSAEAAADLLSSDSARGEDPSLQYSYGLALVRAGRTAEAQSVFDRLVDENPQWPEIHVVLGQAHAQDGDYPAAIQALEHALELNPEVADAHLALGELHLRRGNLEDAEKILRTGLDVRPDDSRTRYLLATVLDLHRKPDEALQLLRGLLARAPDHADGRYLLGKILLAQGTPQEAAIHLEAAARLSPEDPNIHYQLGQAYQKLGDRQSAQSQFERFRILKAAEREASP